MKKINQDKPLGQATIEELQTLLQQRETEQRQRENAELTRRHDFVVTNVDLLLTVFPEHGRTSCSDENSINSTDCGSPRCNRCQLLKIKKDGYNSGMVLEAALIYQECK